MRLRLDFELDTPQMPVDYRRSFISFLKHCLSDVSESYYNEIYGNTDKKDFTFSLYLNKLTKNGDVFELEDKNIIMNMSFLDDMKGYLFFAAISRQRNKKFTLKNNNMKLISVSKSKEVSHFSECMLFKTMSPILLQYHLKEYPEKDHYFSYDEEGFSEFFEFMNKVKFIPVECKKTVTRHFGLDFQGTLGTFMLVGDPYHIEKLYKGGVGNRVGECFGMIEAV